MDWVSFGLGFGFGALLIITIIYLILKRTARWIKKNGLPHTSREREEEIWDDIGRL